MGADPGSQGSRLTRPGGTQGGLSSFLLGLAMACAGGYMIVENTVVTTGFWTWLGLGPSTFGYTLIPLGIGIAWLFFDGRSMVGWALTGACAIFILVGILTSLRIYFQATSLFALIVMLVLFFGGLGLIARAVSTTSEARE